MDWQYSSRLRCYTGLSTVTKPTSGIARDALAYEYDTGDVYVFDGTIWRLKQKGVTQQVSLMNYPHQILVEQKTEADAVDDVVTFLENISTIEIYNTDDTNIGTFTVNGFNIQVPAGKVFMGDIGGTPGTSVSISGVTTYIISRYEWEVL